MQFIEHSQLSYQSLPGAIPHWMYGIQPMGIKVTGPVTLDFTMPSLSGLYDYIPPNGTHVVILGYQSESQLLMPVGIGSIQDKHVISQGNIELDELSYLGYAMVVPTYQTLLQQYAESLISLDTLRAGLSQ